MADEKAKPVRVWPTVKPFVNGGASGMLATCVIQPIDMIKKVVKKLELSSGVEKQAMIAWRKLIRQTCSETLGAEFEENESIPIQTENSYLSE